MPGVTPVTTPDELPTAAVPELLLDHVPPVTESLSEIVAPEQTTEAPVMAGGTEGTELTVTNAVAKELPQELVTAYLIVSIPIDEAVTTPPVLIVATDGVVDIQVPPVVVSESDVVLPVQTISVPAIGAGGTGRGLTVTTAYTEEVPQVLLITYLMVSVPPESPVTIPVGLTTAIDVETLLHVPPPTVSVRCVALPAQTVSVPVIGAGVAGAELTVTANAALEDPQVLETVYLTVSIPDEAPVTIPPEVTVATDVDVVLHTPPLVASVIVAVEPVHMKVRPEMAAGAAGAPMTVSALTV